MSSPSDYLGNVANRPKQGGFGSTATQRSSIPAKAGTPAAERAQQNSFQRANEKRAQISGVRITGTAGGVPVASVPNPFETVTGRADTTSSSSSTASGGGGAPAFAGADAPCTDCQDKIDAAKSDSSGMLFVLALLVLAGGF